MHGKISEQTKAEAEPWDRFDCYTLTGVVEYLHHALTSTAIIQVKDKSSPQFAHLRSARTAAFSVLIKMDVRRRCFDWNLKRRGTAGTSARTDRAGSFSGRHLVTWWVPRVFVKADLGNEGLKWNNLREIMSCCWTCDVSFEGAGWYLPYSTGALHGGEKNSPKQADKITPRTKSHMYKEFWEMWLNVFLTSHPTERLFWSIQRQNKRLSGWKDLPEDTEKKNTVVSRREREPRWYRWSSANLSFACLIRRLSFLNL